jgi:FAD/FMN-containing dehydrogenase
MKKLISKETTEKLKNKVKGEIVLPSDSSYEEVCEVWNAMIERRPALIVRCAEANDVTHAISFAHENELEISIRGAGHNIAGNALCDDGVMIDFSTMRNVRVDAEKQRAYVEPGATLADFDEAAQSHGLATPVGINSTTGIAGLTLGGGFGWLTRKYGMTVDNLLSADVVTANGKRLRASEHENADLFWAIRGGGGNFGVVTQFEFKLHKVGPEILAGLIVFPFRPGKASADTVSRICGIRTGCAQRVGCIAQSSSVAISSWRRVWQGGGCPRHLLHRGCCSRQEID